MVTIASQLALAEPGDPLRGGCSGAGQAGHTPVGGRGGRLSAGERQLIALARVALRDPAVVIFDESTSRVDDETAARLDTALHRLGEQRCFVTIAHRPSTIASADVVFRLEAGAITAAGESQTPRLPERGREIRGERVSFGCEKMVRDLDEGFRDS